MLAAPRPSREGRRLLVRRAWAVIVGAWLGAGVGRLLVEWVPGLADGTGLIVHGAVAVVGAVVGLHEARGMTRSGLPPREPHRVRDTLVAIGALLTPVPAVGVGILLGVPWGPVAGVGVVLICGLAVFVLATWRPRFGLGGGRTERDAFGVPRRP